MLKKKLDEFKLNVFHELNNKWAILVCGDRSTGINGMTISWGTFGVLWNKNIFMAFVRKSRFTHEFAEKSDSFTLSFLSDDYKKEKAIFGSKSGREIDKFELTGLHHTLDVDYNGYYITEADYVIKGKKIASFDLEYNDLPEEIKNNFYSDGDKHTVYICEIKQYLINELKK
ncbi:MAG: flavin reductase [Acholeplasmatales bacterium]|nr:flavin reductase [Acholeplasmatales bacterium]